VTLQVYLRLVGYDPGPIDGLEGPRTYVALVSYAQDRGITLNQATVDVVMALLRAEVHEKLRNGGGRGNQLPRGLGRCSPSNRGRRSRKRATRAV
jgi:peptidoglycan hydrolase-like protein with peptidoglycan-binding domain